MSQQELSELQQITANASTHSNEDISMQYDDVLNGNELLEISHTGGELGALAGGFPTM